MVRPARWALRVAERWQLPIALAVFTGGWLTLAAVLFDIVRTGDAKWATILAAVLVINDGFQAVQAAANADDEA